MNTALTCITSRNRRTTKMAGLQDELRQARAELEERGRMLVSAKQAIEKLQSELDDERAASGELQAQVSFSPPVRIRMRW